MGRWEAGEGVPGNLGGALCLSLCWIWWLLSPCLFLPVSVSFALSHGGSQNSAFTFTVLQGRLLGGKVEMGLTERRAVQTAGVSTQCWSPVAFQQGQTLRIYLVQPLASFYSNSPLQRMPLIDSSVAGWDFSPSHPCFSLLPPCGVCQRIQCSICEYCAESLFSFSLR